MSAVDRFTKSFPVSWDQLHRDARALAWRLGDIAGWKRIVAVTRGGLVPACVVARELDVRLVACIAVASYDHMAQGELTLMSEIEPLAGADAARDLVIDDLVDTGKTLAAIRELLPRAHYAAVYAKPEGRPLVDTYITEVSQDTWIHLPWDLELAFSEPLVRTRGPSGKAASNTD